jgi:hypothetical protein
MNTVLKGIFSTLVVSISLNGFSQKTEDVCYNPNLVKDSTKKSIKSMAFATVNGDSIKINYHSPGVRNRIIWGGLVPFDEVWVTGAHDATTLEMPTAFVVDGKEIPAGKYALFTIPGKNQWVIILNKNWNQHLASEYDEKQDIVRLSVAPSSIVHTERLQYMVDILEDDKATITIAWEKIKVQLPFQLKHAHGKK